MSYNNNYKLSLYKTCQLLTTEYC